MNRTFVTTSLLLISSVAHAHFSLSSPPSYAMQDTFGSPQKSAPCGQADPGSPLTATNQLTSYHEGDTITITLKENIFHPGHYRIALADAQASLPADPVVTADAQSACGSAVIQTSATPGVIIDNQLPHTAALSGTQSISVTLPAGKTCTNCTLQVLEFMSNHPLNNPGGCYYHHCAQINILSKDTPLPDAGVSGSAGGNNGGDAGIASTQPGGCSTTTGEASGLVLVLAALMLRRPRGRSC